MRTVRRSARVRYSASQMFALVDDIASYPEFLSWCQRATIQRRTNDLVEATLEVGLGGVFKQFSTQNRLEPPQRIEIKLLEGPFRSLEGAWTFNDQDDGGCEVNLALDFEVAHTPLDMIFAVLFEEVARAQMAAFIARAETVYD